jgi:heterodisulfide reductase subunit A
MQAGGAAAKVISLFTREALERAPEIAVVDEEVCAGCGYCERICTYKAVTLEPVRKISHVNAAICEGCGACAVACPSGAMQLKNMDNRQIFEMIDVMAGAY